MTSPPCRRIRDFEAGRGILPLLPHQVSGGVHRPGVAGRHAAGISFRKTGVLFFVSLVIVQLRAVFLSQNLYSQLGAAWGQLTHGLFRTAQGTSTSEVH